MSARAILASVEEAIGAHAFANERDRWERNAKEDPAALERALVKLKARVENTRDNPVRNRGFWLESVYRTEVGKAVAS